MAHRKLLLLPHDLRLLARVVELMVPAGSYAAGKEWRSRAVRAAWDICYTPQSIDWTGEDGIWRVHSTSRKRAYLVDVYEHTCEVEVASINLPRLDHEYYAIDENGERVVTANGTHLRYDETALHCEDRTYNNQHFCVHLLKAMIAEAIRVDVQDTRKRDHNGQAR